jgi:hypothetical protein
MVTDSSDEVIAGPKGAGKTTCARRFLAEKLRLRVFVHADMIAARLSPCAPEKAVFEGGGASWCGVRSEVCDDQAGAVESDPCRDRRISVTLRFVVDNNPPRPNHALAIAAPADLCRR